MSATAASWPMMTGALLRFNDVTIGRGGAPEAVAPIATPLRSASLQSGVTLPCTQQTKWATALQCTWAFK